MMSDSYPTTWDPAVMQERIVKLANMVEELGKAIVAVAHSATILATELQKLQQRVDTLEGLEDPT